MIIENTSLKPEDFMQIRRFAVQFVYQQDIHQQFTVETKTLESFVNQAMVPQNQRAFLQMLIGALFDDLKNIDTLIEKHALNWKMSRIAKVDLAVLRVVTLELMQRLGTDVGVLLAEAAAVSHEYGTENSAAFVNGVLDAIAKDVRKE